MSRRIEIELTSTRGDGTWTWRAAGAKQPRGVIEESLLPSGAKVGEVLRVEVEIGLDGMEISSVLPPKSPHKEPDRIELVAVRPEKFEGVITTLIPKQEKRGRERRGPGGDSRGGGDRPTRRPESRPSSPTGRPSSPSSRPPRTERPQSERTSSMSTGANERSVRKPTRPRPAPLTPKSIHRDALLESLPVEQRPIAEQLGSGGLATFRRALADQQTKDKEAGRPVVSGEAILALAEQLLPSVREATWLDRAEAVVERLETVSLRDLRSTVTGAAARSEEAKVLLSKLRTALDDRLNKLRTKWEQEMSHALSEGRVLQALRLSAKPPEPSTRFPAALVEVLATAAGESLSEITQPDRWITLLEAAANSPIRRSIKPSGIPADPTNVVRQAASAAAGRVPALAKLLGLAIPPPPRPMIVHRSTTSVPESASTESAVPESAVPESAVPESAVVDESIS